MKTHFLRKVTLKEFQEWLNSNIHVTWHHSTFGRDDVVDKPGRLRGKYFDIKLDTRTMTIYRIELFGTGPSIIVDFRDSCDENGSLLDELDRRLTEDGK